MPPFHSRSTGARRIADINSFGLIEVASPSIPSASRASADSGIDFALRGHTPPPLAISAVS